MFSWLARLSGRVHVIVGEKNVECLEEEPGSRVAKCVADVFDWLETVISEIRLWGARVHGF